VSHGFGVRTKSTSALVVCLKYEAPQRIVLKIQLLRHRKHRTCRRCVGIVALDAVAGMMTNVLLKHIYCAHCRFLLVGKRSVQVFGSGSNEIPSSIIRFALSPNAKLVDASSAVCVCVCVCV